MKRGTILTEEQKKALVERLKAGKEKAARKKKARSLVSSKLGKINKELDLSNIDVLGFRSPKPRIPKLQKVTYRKIYNEDKKKINELVSNEVKNTKKIIEQEANELNNMIEDNVNRFNMAILRTAERLNYKGKLKKMTVPKYKALLKKHLERKPKLKKIISQPVLIKNPGYYI